MNLLTPALAFGVVLLISGGLFVLGGSFRARKTSEDAKEDTYLCGEAEGSLFAGDREPALQPEYRLFFATAFLFTVVEMGALFLGTIPKGHGYLLPLGFLVLMAASVTAILAEVFGRRS